MHKITLILTFLSLAAGLPAQQASPLWQDIEEPSHPSAVRVITPKAYRTLRLNTTAMLQRLAGAPEEPAVYASASTYTLELPRPDGRMESFRICSSPVMAPGLARRFPQIKTYLGKGIDDPTALLRLDYTPHGLHAMALNGDKAYFIDPYFHLLNNGAYISYYRDDLSSDEEFVCRFEAEGQLPVQEPGTLLANAMTGEELRTYRLAVSTTGEYAQYHGGTVEGAMAAIVTTMNRVNGVYERDLSVRMILADSNHRAVFLDPSSDPFSGSNVDKRNQNQTTLDQVIGSANYDVGHVFDTGGGGVASLETVCVNGEKGLGYTGGANPVGDPFDIDYVAHELGHQFGGLHTFNYCTGSQGERPFEPGSATTIMGYAGLCGANDIASNSNDHFHIGNLADMLSFVELGRGNSCAEKIPTGNTPPEVEAGQSGLVIPISTPFELTATAADLEGDSLTYSWEQFDVGPSTPVSQPQGNAPLFRSYALSASPTRVFPRMASIVNNTQPFGERLPDYSRNMNFRATVRDNHGFGGGVAWDGLTLIVRDQAGPFRVLSQNEPATWQAGSFQLIEWDVANTDQAPVNAEMVNLYLSMDGGYTYPILLADSLENDGQALVVVPDSLAGNQFRVKVKAVGNVFFDINNRDITIEPALAPGLAIGVPRQNRQACSGQPLEYEFFLTPVLGLEGDAALSVTGLPPGVTASFESPLPLPAGSVLTISGLSGLPTGNYPFLLIAGSGGAADTVELNIELYAQAPEGIILSAPAEGEPAVPINTELSWEANPDAATYQVEVALGPGFSDIYFSETGITETTLALPVSLPDSATIYWRVSGSNPGCGAGSFTGSFFETEVIRCQVYRPQGLPLSLESAASIIISRVTVEDDVVVRDVNIRNIRGSHSPLSGLNFRFDSPNGPIIDIVTEDCNGSSFNFSLDDEAASPLPCPFNNGGAYIPEEKLSTYDGENARGDWRLILIKSAQNGSLDNWELEVCFPAGLTGTADAPARPRELKVFPNPAGASLSVALPEDTGRGARLLVSSAAGQALLRQEVRSSEGNEVLDIHALPAGLYFLQLASPEGQLLGSSRFVVAD